jgi:hypothetical protein
MTNATYGRQRGRRRTRRKPARVARAPARCPRLRARLQHVADAATTGLGHPRRCLAGIDVVRPSCRIEWIATLWITAASPRGDV